jgi:thioredoxin-like negative regulator of GroEL
MYDHDADNENPHDQVHEPGAYESFHDGRELLESGNAHAAVVALERARALEPEKASVRETLARAYYRAARFDAAAAEFAIAVELDPVNDYAHFGLGLALRKTADLVGARRHLRIAAAMRPDNPDYRRALAELVGTEGSTDVDSTDNPDAGAP